MLPSSSQVGGPVHLVGVGEPGPAAQAEVHVLGDAVLARHLVGHLAPGNEKEHLGSLQL